MSDENPYAASPGEERRIRRWVTHLLGRDDSRVETEARALCLIFECMLRDRLPELPIGPLERARLDRIAGIRLRAARRPKGRKHRLDAISAVRQRCKDDSLPSA